MAFLPSFFYDANTVDPEELARRRAIALQMLQSATSGAPATTIGEGLAHLGRALAGRMQLNGVTKAEDKARADAYAGISGLFGGAPAAVPGAPPPMAPVVPGGGGGGGGGGKPAAWLQYANAGAIRNQPLNDKLVNSLGFLPELGVTMKVFSGGQDASGPRRTGSHRHDHGNAGDMFFYKDGRKLDWRNPKDLPLFTEIVRRAKANGVTGIGAGEGYMQPGSMHIGFGTPAVWGAGGNGANAADWLRKAFAGGEAPAVPPAAAQAKAMMPSPPPMGTAMTGAPPMAPPPAPTIVPASAPPPAAAPAMPGRQPMTPLQRMIMNALEKGSAVEARPGAFQQSIGRAPVAGGGVFAPAAAMAPAAPPMPPAGPAIGPATAGAPPPAPAPALVGGPAPTPITGGIDENGNPFTIGPGAPGVPLKGGPVASPPPAAPPAAPAAPPAMAAPPSNDRLNRLRAVLMDPKTRLLGDGVIKMLEAEYQLELQKANPDPMQQLQLEKAQIELEKMKKPDPGFRFMTQAEKIAAGLDPNVSAQIGPNGEAKVINDGSAGKPAIQQVELPNGQKIPVDMTNPPDWFKEYQRTGRVPKDFGGGVSPPPKWKEVTLDDGVYLIDENNPTSRMKVGERPNRNEGEGRDFTQTTKLRSEFMAESKPFIDLRTNYQRITASSQDQTGASDIALVYSFMKMLDPTSVVREGEFATAENAGGVPQQVASLYNKVIDGQRLAPEVRKDFLKQARRQYEQQYQTYGAIRKKWRDLASKNSLDPDQVAPDITYGVTPDVNSGDTRPPPATPFIPPAPPTPSVGGSMGSGIGAPGKTDLEGPPPGWEKYWPVMKPDAKKKVLDKYRETGGK